MDPNSCGSRRSGCRRCAPCIPARRCEPPIEAPPSRAPRASGRATRRSSSCCADAWRSPGRRRPRRSPGAGDRRRRRRRGAARARSRRRRAARDVFANAAGLRFCGRSRGRPGLEWCDRRLLARIHRYTLNRLRAEIEPVSPADFMRFLFAWQHVDPSEPPDRHRRPARRPRIARRLRARRRRVGARGPAGARRRLPAVDARHAVPHRRSRLGAAVASAARRDAARRRDADRAVPPRARRRVGDAADRRRTGWPRWLRKSGQQGFSPLRTRATRCARAERRSSRSDDRLRARRSRGPRRPWRSRGRRPRRVGRIRRPADHRTRVERTARVARGAQQRHRTLVAAPRAGAPNAIFGAVSPRRSRGRAAGATLLKRYGVVFRRLLAREANVAPWRELTRVYRRLEARGEIRGGRFVSGMSGEQFALAGRDRAAARDPPHAA